MSKIIFNKKLVSANVPCISPNDRGFSLGHGIFETILIKKNTYPALDYHWKRLVISAPILGISLPFSWEDLRLMLNNLIITNNLQNQLASARITLTHGEAARGILPVHQTNPNFLITAIEYSLTNDNPFSVLIVSIRKNEHTPSARVKTISYIDNILAKKEAMEKGYDEAVLLNTSSNIADGSFSNIFMVKDNLIITPPICDGALPGVIRSILLEEFSKNFSFIEKSITQADLLQADEIFLTNALMGIKPVNQVNTKFFSVGPIAKKLSKLLQEKKSYI